jgi:hypothetical protein
MLTNEELGPEKYKKARAILEQSLRIIDEDEENDLPYLIPQLVGLLREYYTIYGENRTRDELYSDAKFTIQIWHILDRMPSEKIPKLCKDLPALVRRVQMKAIKGGRA